MGKTGRRIDEKVFGLRADSEENMSTANRSVKGIHAEWLYALLQRLGQEARLG